MRIGALIAMVGFSLVAGCASDQSVDAGPHPSWPPPPSPTRIVHRRTFLGAQSIKHTGILESLGALLTGDRKQPLGEPNSVAVSGRWMAVSDQSFQAVHLFDMNNGHSSLIDRVDKKTFFVSPVGVAFCGNDIAISDSALRRVLLMTLDGKLVREFTPPGGFTRPTCLAFNPRTNQLYIVDTARHVIDVFKLDGTFVRRIGQPGGDPGQFNFPTHICIDAMNRLCVTDSLNFRVQVFDAADQYQFEIGRHGDASGHFGVPKGVAVDREGHIYVVDSYFAVVQIFDDQGRFLLSFGAPGKQVGQFDVPTGIAIDVDDHIYIVDSQNHRVQIFQYTGASSDAAPPQH